MKGDVGQFFPFQEREHLRSRNIQPSLRVATQLILRRRQRNARRGNNLSSYRDFWKHVGGLTDQSPI